MIRAGDFEDWVAITKTKARYCRFLDTKQWDAWATVFTEDLVLDTSEAGGGPAITGRATAIAMVRQSIDNAKTAHHVNNPEITIDGARADVVWAMQDRVVFDNGHSLTGYGHYIETYVKQDGQWRISSIKLTRLHVDMSAPAAA